LLSQRGRLMSMPRRSSRRAWTPVGLGIVAGLPPKIPDRVKLRTAPAMGVSAQINRIGAGCRSAAPGRDTR